MRSSGEEHFLDTEGVSGSIPLAPTIVFNSSGFLTPGYFTNTVKWGVQTSGQGKGQTTREQMARVLQTVHKDGTVAGVEDPE